MPTNLTEFKNTIGMMLASGDLPLPSTVTPEAFRNAAIVAVQDNSDILTKCTPESIFRAVRRLAGMGLVPDGRLAAIVRYGNQASAHMMIAGMIQVVRNSGLVSSMSADVVYEGETIDIYIEDGQRQWDHTNEDGSRLDAMKRGGKIIGAYALAKLKDGSFDFEPMTLEQIERRRKASPNQKGENPTGIWKDWYDEMAKKTAMRALCKRLPMSSEDHTRIEHDQGFRELRDVTPAPVESTEDRLRRLALVNKEIPDGPNETSYNLSDEERAQEEAALQGFKDKEGVSAE